MTVITDYDYILQSLLASGNTSYAYAVRETHANLLLTLTNTSSEFHKMKQNLCKKDRSLSELNFNNFFIWFTDDYRLCVGSNKYSPYEDRIADVLLKIIEYGIMEHLRVIAKMELKLTRLSEPEKVFHDGKSDLNYGFLMYVIGIIMATIAFWSEQLVFKMRADQE